MLSRSDGLLLSLLLLLPVIVGLLAVRELVRGIISMIVAGLGGV